MKISMKIILVFVIIFLAVSSLTPKGSSSSKRNAPSQSDTNNAEKDFVRILNKNYTQFQVKKTNVYKI